MFDDGVVQILHQHAEAPHHIIALHQLSVSGDCVSNVNVCSNTTQNLSPDLSRRNCHGNVMNIIPTLNSKDTFLWLNQTGAI